MTTKIVEPKPVSSDSVSWVTLLTRTEQVTARDYENGLGEPIEDSFREDMQIVSASLLKDFKPTELSEDADRIDFPGGFMKLETIEDTSNYLYRFGVKLVLDCRSKHRAMTESILSRLDDLPNFWHVIGFEMEKCIFDMDVLKAICDDKGYEVKRFRRKLLRSLLRKLGIGFPSEFL